MHDDDFEGTTVLERLAASGEVDAFLAAVDNDDFDLARRLMKRAGVDPETIRMTLLKMAEGD